MKELVFQQANVHLYIVQAQLDNVEHLSCVKLSDITVSIDSTVVFCKHIESLPCACMSDQRLYLISQIS